MKSFLNFKRLGFHSNKKLTKAEKKGRTREFIAKLSKGIMLPISMLPIAGIFLGVGSAITSNAGNNVGLSIFGNFLSTPGNAIFGSLALLFAIAIAIAFTGDSGPAALASFVAFLVFSAVQQALIVPVSAINANGANDIVGYNLLFYLPHSLGNYSASAPNYAMLYQQINGDIKITQIGTNFANVISVLHNLVNNANSSLSSIFKTDPSVINLTSIDLTKHTLLTPNNVTDLKHVATLLTTNAALIEAHKSSVFVNSGNITSLNSGANNLMSVIQNINNQGYVYGGLQPSLFSKVAGINQLTSSVFGGILVGFIVAFLYKKFYKIKLPVVLGFFSGVRFIPIIAFLVFFPVTVIFLMLWPLMGTLLYLIGQSLSYTLGFNSFVQGLVNRMLEPFGLHHAFYAPLWYTAAGGSVNFTAEAVIYRNHIAYAIAAHGQKLNGDIQTWQQLIVSLNPNNAGNYTPGTFNNPNTIGGDSYTFIQLNKTLLGRAVDLYPATHLSGGIDDGKYALNTNNNLKVIFNTPLVWSDLTGSISAINYNGANGFVGVNVGQYLQGSYIFDITALPASCLGMIMAAPKENRKVAASILVSAALTSFLTGITEPIEFTFLFLAPWLYWGVHSFFCALAYGILNWVGLIAIAAGNPAIAPHIGETFSGGIIDWIIYGGIQLQFGSNGWWSWVFAIPYAFIYYFLWKYFVIKFNLATPGREGNEAKLFTKADYIAKSVLKDLNFNKDQLLALNVIGAYGGFDNILNVDACITKLRVEVNKKDLVKRDLLISLGAKGTIDPSPSSLYAVFGVEADIIKNNIKGLSKDVSQNSKLKEQLEKAITSMQTAFSENKKETTNTSGTFDLKLANEHLIVYSPIDGTIVEQQQIEDETFKNNLVGLGVAIKPSSNDFVAPIDGKLSMVFNTKHAYTFESKNGSQIMVHIGIDSIKIVNEQNETIDPFDAKVATNDKILKGSLFASVDLDKLKYAKAMTTPVVILNESIANREVKILKTSGFVKKGEPLFEIIPKKIN